MKRKEITTIHMTLYKTLKSNYLKNIQFIIENNDDEIMNYIIKDILMYKESFGVVYPVNKIKVNDNEVVLSFDDPYIKDSIDLYFTITESDNIDYYCSEERKHLNVCVLERIKNLDIPSLVEEIRGEFDDI